MPIAEMQWDHSGQSLQYTGFSSCLGLNIILTNPDEIFGAHFVYDRAGEIPNLLTTIHQGMPNGSVIQGIYLIGVTSIWRNNDKLTQVQQWVMAEFNNDQIDIKSTSGESEIITVTFGNPGNINVDVQYPAHAIERSLGGAVNTFPRVVPSMDIL
jgi:hypothetical protein